MGRKEIRREARNREKKAVTKGASGWCGLGRGLLAQRRRKQRGK